MCSAFGWMGQQRCLGTGKWSFLRKIYYKNIQRLLSSAATKEHLLRLGTDTRKTMKIILRASLDEESQEKMGKTNKSAATLCSIAETKKKRIYWPVSVYGKRCAPRVGSQQMVAANVWECRVLCVAHSAPTIFKHTHQIVAAFSLFLANASNASTSRHMNTSRINTSFQHTQSRSQHTFL